MKKQYQAQNSVIGLFIFIFIALLSNLSYSAPLPTVEIKQTPEWVIKHDIKAQKEIPVSEIVDGEYFLHVDKQIKVENGKQNEYFERYAILVKNEAGMDSVSQFSITFDPSYEQIVMHYVRVKRGNQLINKTNDIQIELLRREKRLESLIYDGRYTANIIIEDVRIGDIVEYAYTTIGENPIYQNHFSYNLWVNWRVPVERLTFRLKWPANRSLFIKNYQSDAELTIIEDGEDKVYSLDLKKIKKINYDSNTPVWYTPFGTIQLSEFNTWKEVINWALPLYESGYRKYPEIESIAKNIVEKHDNDTDRFMAMLNLIQKEIRYLGIEMGVNSHKPSRPDETLTRRYGDCKDKTVVLICLLRAAGIDARPVLVNTKMRHKLKELQPKINAFNHVLVKAEVANKTVWADPTRIYQGNNFSWLYQPDYGYALIIDPTVSDLTLMPDNSRFSEVKINETISLLSGKGAPADYEIETAYQGIDAEKMRYRLAEEGRQNVEDGFLEFYSRYYSKIEKKQNINIDDNKGKNQIRLKEYYLLNNFWEKDESTHESTGSIYSNGIASYLKSPSQVQRTQPLALTHPVSVSQSITVLFPEPWAVEQFNFIEDNPYFHFSAKVSYESNNKSAKLVYTYKSKTDNVPPNGIDSYLEALKRANNNIDYELYYDNTIAQPSWLSKLPDQYDLFYLGIIAACFILLGYIAIEWGLDSRKTNVVLTGNFHPVSEIKFCILSLSTFGLYQVYWLYKQWQFIREKENLALMPFWRAFFAPVWFFSFHHHLKADSMDRFGSNRLPPSFVVFLLFSGYLICTLSSRIDNIFGQLTYISFLFLLPFVNYINYINHENKETIEFNSRFRPRHYILGVFALLLFSYSISAELNIIPNGKVMEGKQVPEWNIKKMQRNGLLLSNQSLIYFYSDSFLSYGSDGNGITDKEVFSYWKDDSTGKLEIQRAKYDDIEDIEVDYGNSEDDITVITIKARNRSDFVLYMAAENKMDRKVISEIRKRMSE